MAAPMANVDAIHSCQNEMEIDESNISGKRNNKSKIPKSERRLFKKQSKMKHMLQNSSGINVSAVPTLNIAVCNGGLGNNVQRSELFEIFAEYGEIGDIIMIAEKPYCYVCFRLINSAVKAYEAVNGKEFKSLGGAVQHNITLYLFYVENVEESACSGSDLPEGLLLVRDFITSADEDKLLQCVDWSDEEEQATCMAKGTLKHRQVKHYGYEFRYDNNNVDKDKPLNHGIPSECDQIINKMLEMGYIQWRPDQLTVNQYLPGQGIPPHVDTHSAFEDGIISLSLGSQVVMEFRHPDGRHVPVMLPPRSLLVMKGESRYLWNHGITPRKSDILPDPSESQCEQRLTLSPRGTRTSFTFRKIRQEPCNCDYPSHCDSQKDKKKAVQNLQPVSSEEAVILESEHVHKVYEQIAQDFSGTRHSPWPRVVEFMKQLPSGSLIADIGCGNGKYLLGNAAHFKVGCDRSKALCEICAERHLEVFTCDALAVPLRSDVFDAALSIAVIHHMSTEERRLQAVSEVLRVLAPGGQALVYVWALEQEYKNVKSNYLKDYKETNNITTGEFPLPHSNQDSTTSPTEDLSKNIKEHLSVESHNTDAKSHVEAAAKPGTSSEGQTLNLSVHVNRTQFKEKDLLVPWHLKNKSKFLAVTDGDGPSGKTNIYHRFYHVFQEQELEQLCSKLPGLSIINSYYDKGNWCIVIQKDLSSG